jgi:hypothetical protein
MRPVALLIAFLLASHLVADERANYRKKFLADMLHETNIGYHSSHPTAPVHIPGLSGESTPEEIHFNEQILNRPHKCVFQGDSSVEGEDWPESARRKKVSTLGPTREDNARNFIKSCLQIKQELGSEACSVIEIAGHAEGYSVGLGDVFGFKVEKGQWKKFPENDKLFQEAAKCLRDISQPRAPIVFSSCGAGSVDDYFPVKKLQGRKLYYPSKFEAQQLISNILGRTVFSARGAENLQDWGKHCRDGWCRTEPESNSVLVYPLELKKLLPEPKMNWDIEGNLLQHE